MEKLRLSAKMEHLDAFQAFIRQFADDCHLAAFKTRQLDVAMEEILVNIIRYAYPERQGDIEITCDTNAANDLVITIQDNGIVFNALERAEPDTTASVMDRPIGGLGILLVKKMMDDVRYERVGERNVITLIKHK